MAEYYIVTATKSCAPSSFYREGVATQEEAGIIYGKLMMDEIGGYLGGIIAGPGLIRYNRIYDTRIEIAGPYELNIVPDNGRYTCFEDFGHESEGATKEEAIANWLEYANG